MSKNKALLWKYGNYELLNRDTFDYYFNYFFNYAINMFEWLNLPDTIDERYLEIMLHTLGYVCFFKDNSLGGMIKTKDEIGLPDYLEEKDIYLCLNASIGGRMNIYNYPTNYHINTPSGYHTERSKNDAVIIYNNRMHVPTTRPLEILAYRITRIERTIDVNLCNLKHPYVFAIPESQRLSFEQLWNETNDFKEKIVVDSKMDLSGATVLNTNVENSTLDLYDLKKQYIYEALTFLGINNANTDKKERLITNEVEANNEQLYMSRQVMLDSRKEACKQINEMFGLNIDVRFRAEEEQERVIELNNEQSSVNGKEDTNLP